MKANINREMPPLEIWADGIAEYVTWKSGRYVLKPNAPSWAETKLKEYEELTGVSEEDGMITVR